MLPLTDDFIIERVTWITSPGQIDIKDKRLGQTALHIAAERGRLETV